MKERGMIFKAEMVRALLAGTKRQTRRVVKLPHNSPLGRWEPTISGGPGTYLDRAMTIPAPSRTAIWHTRTGDCLLCPYGDVGNRIWVRETFWCDKTTKAFKWYVNDIFTPDRERDHCMLKPGIFMRRSESRIALGLTAVRVERLQEISVEDAEVEGLKKLSKDGGRVWKYGIPDRDGEPGEDDIGWHWHRWRMSPVDAYQALWESINGPGSWDANPWVWVLEFRKI